MAAIGYRCGAIGDYLGGSRQDRQDASIAWKALNYEVTKLGNEDIVESVARFLRVPVASWSDILAEFRHRYGDTPGIWLSRNKREAELYQEYGDPESVSYQERNVVVDLGGDGIYVLLSNPKTPTGHKASKGARYTVIAASKRRLPKTAPATLRLLR